jgi:uncharacterized protein YecT (DUF1311 family)
MRNSWLMVLLIAGGVAHAASFDCSKAKTAQEKAICGSPELSAVDDRMAAAYHDVMAAATPEIQAELRDGQRAWIRGMGVKCPGGASQSLTDLQKCLLDYESARMKDLQKMVMRANGVTFVWRSISVTIPDGPDSMPPNMRYMERNPGFGTLIASWPQAIQDTPEWSAWNVAIVDATQKIAIETIGGSPGNSPRKWTAEEGVDSDVAVSIGVVAGQIVTATINDHYDGHGAHPNDYSIQFNWLLKEQREVRAEDLFRSNSGWDTAILGQCENDVSRQLTEQMGADNASTWLADLPKKLHGIILDPRNWVLDGKGLTIPFQPYAVACYACTPNPVTVPWTALQPFLQPGFVVPK